MSYTVMAQKRTQEWQIGYFAPYITNIGGTIGHTLDIKKLGTSSIKQKKSVHRLQLLSQVSYFAQLKVSNNISLNPEIVYRWNKTDKHFFLSSSIGAGYLVSFQRQEGTVNLATGEIVYRNEAINYFLPNLNVGIGLDPKYHFGYYLKGTYGRKISPETADAAFFSISTGMIIKFYSKNKK